MKNKIYSEMCKDVIEYLKRRKKEFVLEKVSTGQNKVSVFGHK